ncbi:MAG: hypothetical protein AB7F82_07065 [Alphaproteobacteria bacterium]
MMLTGCGIPPSDIAIGSAVTYALYGDELEEVDAEDLEDPQTYRDAVPPSLKDSAKRTATNVRDNVRHNSRKLKEWWFYDPAKERVKNEHAIAPSYCYAVMQDIVCYPAPMPGWEARLVGYQGSAPIAVAVVKTEPVPHLPKTDRITPEDRLKKADPVFDAIPEEVKKERAEGEAISGSAQEILPDPQISPQL